MNSRLRKGFSIIELAVITIIFSILLSVVAPKVTTAMVHTRVNKAAAVLAADVRQGFELAGRARAPMRLSYTASSMTYSLSNRATGAVLRSRSMGPTSEYKLTSLTFSPATIDFFPAGISSANLTVTVAGSGYSRTVTATTAGLVRAP